MIPRYTREEMGHIWSERNEFDTMLLVETLASEAQAELGVIPKEAAKIIREKGNFDVERIHEIERETNHDIISFVTAVGEYVGPEAAKYIHLGLTSTDVKDTALGYMMKQSCDILIEDLRNITRCIAPSRCRIQTYAYDWSYSRYSRRTYYIRFKTLPLDGRGRTRYRTHGTCS